jgi:hypothetical protein
MSSGADGKLANIGSLKIWEAWKQGIGKQRTGKQRN